MYERYGRPLEILDMMIAQKRLAEFVDEVVKIKNEEVGEKAQWEYYLHRIYDISFEEFAEQINAAALSNISEAEMKADEIIEKSRNILHHTMIGGG